MLWSVSKVADRSGTMRDGGPVSAVMNRSVVSLTSAFLCGGLEGNQNEMFHTDCLVSDGYAVWQPLHFPAHFREMGGFINNP